MYITGREYPFNTERFNSYIEDVRINVQKEIDTYSSEKILNTSTNDLADYFYEKYVIDDIPLLSGEPIMFPPRDAQVKTPYNYFSGFDSGYDSNYVKGTALDFEVPFSGNAKFFRYQPSSWSTCYPDITITSEKMLFSVMLFKDEFENTDGIKNIVANTITQIKQALETLHKDADNFNQRLRNLAYEWIEIRKKELLAKEKLVANLGFQIKTKTQQTYAVTITKKKIELIPPSASSEPYNPEPCLLETSYEEILKTLDLMSETMEKSPSAFKDMDEESIRTHFLVDLNGMFEGSASGETFNKNGKTDILITENGKNIFIGECKFWKGEKHFLETIDQILGYLTWRDTKACILVFNRKKNLSEVLLKIKEAVIKHPNYKRSICEKSETDFRYIFANTEDKNREIFLAVKVYDIPTD